MRQTYNIFSYIAIAICVMTLFGCGSSEDLQGQATLKVAGDCESGSFLRVIVNGQTLGDEKDRRISKEYTFNNAKSGKNKLLLQVHFSDDTTKEKSFEFSSLPGGVTKVTLRITWSFGTTVDADVTTEKLGTHPAVTAQIARDKAQAEEDERERERKEKETKERERTELEGDMQKFAKEFIPALQQAIDRYQEQIKQFIQQRENFVKEMAKVGVVPDSRPAYVRKGEIIEKMKQDVVDLISARKEMYIKWKEVNLLSDPADTQKQRAMLLENAKNRTKDAEETFNKYMEQSRDTDGK